MSVLRHLADRRHHPASLPDVGALLIWAGVLLFLFPGLLR
jgi:hypothetical protein